jgi:hypothetical protein
MITKEHNDGGCFKVMITLTNENYDELEQTFYGEDFTEIFDHIREINKNLFNAYVSKIVIQDDSK